MVWYFSTILNLISGTAGVAICIERMIADHMKELSLNNIAWSPAGNNSMLEGMYREYDS